MGKIWKWISRAADLSELQWSLSGVLAVLVAIWSAIADLPGPVIFALAVWVFAGVVAVVLGVLRISDRFRQRKDRADVASAVLPTVQLFEDRAALNRTTGGLLKEVATIEHGWLALYVGAHASDTEIFESRRISRLVLIDPEGNFIKSFAPAFERTPEEMRNRIRETTRRAKAFDVDVRWFDGPITSMLIADVGRDGAWARIEVGLPLVSAGVRPGFRITRSRHAIAFEGIKRSYERLWEESKPAT